MDAASCSNLESICCGPSDNFLEAFIMLFENLLPTFRVQPSQDHLLNVFMRRVQDIPGLATTMANLKRIPHGHANKNLQFFKDACTGLMEEMRPERQLAEVAKVYKKGGTDVALVAMIEAEKNKAPCIAFRDGKPCAAGGLCPYSHNAKIIVEATMRTRRRKGSQRLLRRLARDKTRARSASRTTRRAFASCSTAPKAATDVRFSSRSIVSSKRCRTRKRSSVSRSSRCGAIIFSISSGSDGRRPEPKGQV